MKKTRTPFVVTLCNYGTFEDVSPLFRHCHRPPVFFASFLKLANKKEMNKIHGYIPGEERFLTTKNPTLKGILRVHHFTCKVKRKNLENVSVPWIFFIAGCYSLPLMTPVLIGRLALFFWEKDPSKNRGHEGAGPHIGWFCFLD